MSYIARSTDGLFGIYDTETDAVNAVRSSIKGLCKQSYLMHSSQKVFRDTKEYELVGESTEVVNSHLTIKYYTFKTKSNSMVYHAKICINHFNSYETIEYESNSKDTITSIINEFKETDLNNEHFDVRYRKSSRIACFACTTCTTVDLFKENDDNEGYCYSNEKQMKDIVPIMRIDYTHDDLVTDNDNTGIDDYINKCYYIYKV